MANTYDFLGDYKGYFTNPVVKSIVMLRARFNMLVRLTMKLNSMQEQNM